MNILAADIGGTNTKMGVCNEQGHIEQYSEYTTESLKGGPHVMERLIAHLAAYEHDRYDAIAISTAGQVNAEQGYIVYANENIPNYTGTKISELLTSRFHKPVRVENDVNAAALGEAHFGAARSFGDFLCLTFGTGIGGAIVMNRRIYRGADGVAAEFGHMFARPAHAALRGGGGKPYYETFASTTALIRMAAQVDPTCTDGRLLFAKISEGDEKLNDVLQRWVAEVCAGLASLVHIFNPSAIVIGGGVMEQDDLVRLVERQTKQLVMDSFRGVHILKASLGNKAGLLGAASLFIFPQKE
ncbi:MAG: family transcriptional regulator [Paenibacillus sp.]|nr:family transcriptional regulator [Paenibacillus sp.]